MALGNPSWIKKSVILTKYTIAKHGRKNKVPIFVKIKVHRNENSLDLKYTKVVQEFQLVYIMT